MAKDNEIVRAVRLQEKSDDEESFRARVGVRVADDKSGDILGSATILVSGEDSNYETEKTSDKMGRLTWFENVPLPAKLRVEATDKDPYEERLTEANLGSDKQVE